MYLVVVVVVAVVVVAAAVDPLGPPSYWGMAYGSACVVKGGSLPWGRRDSCVGRHELVNFDLAGTVVQVLVDLVADRDAFDASCFGAGGSSWACVGL